MPNYVSEQREFKKEVKRIEKEKHLKQAEFDEFSKRMREKIEKRQKR